MTGALGIHVVGGLGAIERSAETALRRRGSALAVAVLAMGCAVAAVQARANGSASPYRRCSHARNVFDKWSMLTAQRREALRRDAGQVTGVTAGQAGQ